MGVHAAAGSSMQIASSVPTEGCQHHCRKTSIVCGAEIWVLATLIKPNMKMFFSQSLGSRSTCAQIHRDKSHVDEAQLKSALLS